jgi:hypothetical protein
MGEWGMDECLNRPVIAPARRRREELDEAIPSTGTSLHQPAVEGGVFDEAIWQIGDKQKAGPYFLCPYA